MDNKVFYKIGYGLYVLTVKDGDLENGCITNSVMQVTTNPNILVVSLNKANFTTELALKTKKFNISFLDTNTKFDMIKRFGFVSGRNKNKFEGYTIDRASNEIAIIKENTNAYIECKVLDYQDFGSHILFKVEAVGGEVLSDTESLTYSYYHSHVKPKPQAKPAGKTVWRCRICGYEYEGEELPKDFICPWCKHGAEDFEKVVK